MVTNIQRWGWVFVTLTGWGFYWSGRVNIVAYILWGLAIIWVIVIVVVAIRGKHIIKEGEQMPAGDKRNIIKDTEIKAKVKHAKEATALDIDKADTELSNVKVKLEAEDVEKATAMKVTGSGGDAVMSMHMMQCSNCSRRFSKVFTGHLPEETACPHCGHMNKVEK